MDNETIVFEKILATVKNNPNDDIVTTVANVVRYLELPDILTDRDLTRSIERVSNHLNSPQYWGEEVAQKVMRRLFMEE